MVVVGWGREVGRSDLRAAGEKAHSQVRAREGLSQQGLCTVHRISEVLGQGQAQSLR